MTRDEWALSRNSLDQQKGDKYGDKNLPLVASIGEKYVVYSGLGELMIFITGSCEYDELILMDILATMIEIVKGICKKGVTEAGVIEAYHKISIHSDELIKSGFLNIIQNDTIYSYAHMKYDKTTK
eukprot:TRINITY_DN2714_c0_g1_i2.p1 TRINITY_DN2714_c0_g1~~TRINITY_DN2714_c0_g1_i2.p1  ORF type:complete len:126 (-),score=25.38 TRINITY_DN2714_c0_g1_i2:99-476(-)